MQLPPPAPSAEAISRTMNSLAAHQPLGVLTSVFCSDARAWILAHINGQDPQRVADWDTHMGTVYASDTTHARSLLQGIPNSDASLGHRIPKQFLQELHRDAEKETRYRTRNAVDISCLDRI
ncbi:hypothetical protein IEU95_01715 [Hoyosella rhizosphaerae]|uniref:Uncharacterized protein n=1 Tax=Hoyosella rhizosphaerae TaxID=1755582 RepID=A0A916UF06_9ACTN|nr:hypothetical protein [Hoyosella rhizosphaerae]MBN4925532.1 hypothetical protein [Hoyosella rhizosphaerae]GGC69897.1 hypothetical protein GCM10011410_23430 [Hoyosella rhizosphaerae]